MMANEAIKDALGNWAELREIDRGVRVSTHCLYPSNTTVSVVVTQRGEDRFRVDDDGQAFDELSQVLVTDQKLPKLIRGIVRHRGCELTECGQIISPVVSSQELRGAVILLANASKAAAEHLVGTVRPPRKDLRHIIEAMLELKFKDRWRRDGRLVGASNKEHGFDYLINISHGRQLALDFVVPDSSSVNSAVVAHLDVGHKNNPDLEQRIVYDDSRPWRAEDIQLLKAGARPVPLSALAQSLERLAA